MKDFDHLLAGKIVRCFMDGIDWQHHLDADISGTRLWPDEQSCRDNNPCLPRCGMVEVEVRMIRWVQPQNMEADFESD